jgi:hypothetical protein
MKNVKEEQPKIRFVIWTDPSGKYRIVRKDISPGSQYHSFAYEVLYMNHMDEKIWLRFDAETLNLYDKESGNLFVSDN